jgi:hypothetical protein
MTRFALIASLSLFFGCGNDNPNGNTGGSGGSGGTEQPDAAPPMPDGPDHGNPSTTYPAFPPDMPTIGSNGGPVLQAMELTTITWPSDTNAAQYNAFGDTIGASTYWHTINSEYGVGPVASNSHQSLTTAAPTSMTDQDIQTLIAMKASDTTSGWPAPSANSLYAIFLPQGTSLDFGGSDACSQGIGGYHDQLRAGTRNVAYAVLPNCGRVNSVLEAASHEYDEAATDPYPQSTPGFVGFDNDHLAFEFFQELQDELGDACELFRSSFYTDMENGFNYPVQRQWSNASAHAGHNPCVPAPSGAYFNVTPFPAQMDTIMVNLRAVGAGNQPSKGFKGTAMQPLTFAVGFYSDADTGGPWTVSASIPTQLFASVGSPVTNGTADVAIDMPMGQNGNKAYITVTPKTFSSMGVIYIELTSMLTSSNKHYMPILIGQ